MSTSTSTTERKAAIKALAPIRPDELYPLSVLQSHSGLGEAAIRELKKRGLEMRYVGGRVFVFGDDFLAAVRQYGKRSKDEPAQPVKK